ncbi:hypothetical protein [Spirosoma spitsbergense]|uniref:hypothetical protein n=1 Tax=Spirosoma spitsbergense TaxID=431554 RepID=UPI00036F47FF|nr:hypothetical protein [Spirosoma spitsbergense]
MPRTHTQLARILLVAVTLAVGSVYGYYYGREWAAKWAFAHQTEFGLDELVLIAIPQADLSPNNDFLIHQEEFAWQGEMIDMLHREVRSDTLFVYGFRDEAETELRQEAAWLYRDPNQPDPLSDARTKRARWCSPFVLPYKVIIAPVSDSILPEFTHLFSFSSPRIRLPLLDVTVPPPDL